MSFEGASTGAVNGSSGSGSQVQALNVRSGSVRLVGNFGGGTFVGSLSNAGCVYDYTLYKVTKSDRFATSTPPPSFTAPSLGNPRVATQTIQGSYSRDRRQEPAPEYRSASREADKKAKSEATAQREARRGEQLLGKGKIVEARQLFERAALAGNARGALGLGMTYDPSFLFSINSRDAGADALVAKIWYRRAQMFGNKDATGMLAKLETWKPG